MRFLLFPIYSSFFITIIGSPIDFASDDLYSNDIAADLDTTETQTTPTIDSTIKVAQNNVDYIDSDVIPPETPLSSDSETTVALADVAPTTDPNLDGQSGTYIASNKQVSTQSTSSTSTDLKAQIQNCKKNFKSKPCIIFGIKCM